MANSNLSSSFEMMKFNHDKLVSCKNEVDTTFYNGCFERYKNPVLTAEHVPLEWRYDLDPKSNPYRIERLGINAVFNAGAIEYNGKIALVCRVEGFDRKSFFAVAESENRQAGVSSGQRHRAVLTPCR